MTAINSISKNNCCKQLSSAMIFLCSFFLFSYYLQAQSGRYNGKHPSAGRIAKHKYKPPRGYKPRYPHSKAELESKITFGIYTGEIFTTGGEKINAGGVSENIFGSAKSAPIIGGLLTYNFTNRISVGLKLKYGYIVKPLYKINNVTLGLDFKYHFIKSDRRVSPYFTAGVNYSLVGINQKINDYSYYPEESYSVKNESHILINEIHYYNPAVVLSFVPMAGWNVGMGTNIKVKDNWNLFLQVEYNSSYASNSRLIKESFYYNTSDFNYVVFMAGVNIKMFRSKYLY